MTTTVSFGTTKWKIIPIPSSSNPPPLKLYVKNIQNFVDIHNKQSQYFYSNSFVVSSIELLLKKYPKMTDILSQEDTQSLIEIIKHHKMLTQDTLMTQEDILIEKIINEFDLQCFIGRGK